MSAPHNIANQLWDQSNAAVLDIEITGRTATANILIVTRRDCVRQKLPCVRFRYTYTGQFVVSCFYFHPLCISFFYFNCGNNRRADPPRPSKTHTHTTTTIEHVRGCLGASELHCFSKANKTKLTLFVLPHAHQNPPPPPPTPPPPPIITDEIPHCQGRQFNKVDKTISDQVTNNHTHPSFKITWEDLNLPRGQEVTSLQMHCVSWLPPAEGY